MSDQKNWDAALIKTWRTNANVGDALKLFTALSGKYVTDCDPPLKRIPPIGLPWYVGVRVFAAAHLPKISTWMWDHNADRDIDLLRKLEGSNYDCLEKAISDAEVANARSAMRRDEKRIAMSTLAYSNRNNDTNGNIVKGGSVGRRK